MKQNRSLVMLVQNNQLEECKMATVGQQLTAPEAGWRRLDDLDINIARIGTGWAVSNDAGAWGGKAWYTTTAGDQIIQFNFTGDKIRILTPVSPGPWVVSNDVYLDGIKVSSFNQINASVMYNIIEFQALNLENKEHFVQIKAHCNTGDTFCIDAIDIDETGELLPYNPTPEEPEDPKQALLRVTVIDSSDHDYQLSSSEIDGFINWFMNHTNTDTACYLLTKKTGTQISKEYLAFDKIISFEVIPIA